MAQRVTERFPEGSRVEIQFSADVYARWWAGTVTAHQFPGVWVQVTSGDRFFVTNGKRIRHQTATPKAA